MVFSVIMLVFLRVLGLLVVPVPSRSPIIEFRYACSRVRQVPSQEIGHSLSEGSLTVLVNRAQTVYLVPGLLNRGESPGGRHAVPDHHVTPIPHSDCVFIIGYHAAAVFDFSARACRAATACGLW
jgi:hypothetical protein